MSPQAGWGVMASDRSIFCEQLMSQTHNTRTWISTSAGRVAKTYDKAIHFWQADRGDTLPQVMMALTRDGQLYDNLAQDVEKRYNVSFGEEREKRAYMKGPANGIHPMANGGGRGLQMVL